MKLVLTKSQALTILQALEWAENEDYPDTDPINAKYIRIENKIREELGLPKRENASTKQYEADRELEKQWGEGKISQEDYIQKKEEIWK